VAQDQAQIKGLRQSSLIFTGALLPDIGKVVLDQFVKSAIDQILIRVKTQNITFRKAEHQVLGFDHAQVGSLLAKNWHLPPLLQCIIRYYHTPSDAKGCFLEASIVNLADAVYRKIAVGLGLDGPSYPEDDRVTGSIGLNESEIQGVIDGFGMKMERVNALFAGGNHR